ncbi:MAG: hypothetical protein K1060chlam4_00414 [Candidatus Anoxychlamydiales bacterium]|nr:hypothetical protein [Candidatus Anoxychlamydiales bacterium]
MKIRNETAMLRPKIQNKESSIPKILNPESLKKINSTFSKAHQMECSDCDTMDHGCFCDFGMGN